MKIRSVFFWFFAVLPAWPGIPEKFGLAAWQTGLSGAGVAAISDPTAAYFNPGGLTAGNPDTAGVKNAFLFGAGFQRPDFKVSPNAASPLAKANARLGEEVIYYSTLNVGMAFDLRSLMKLPDEFPLVLGVVASLAGDGSDVVKLNEESGKSYSFQGVGRSAIRPTVAASLSAQIWKDRLSIGAGSSFLAAADGKLRVEKIDTTGLPPTSEMQIRLKLRPALLAGLQFRQPVGEHHTIFIGGAWRQENYVSADVGIDVQLPPVSGISVLHQTALHILSYYEPHVLTGGIGYRYKRAAFFADIEYQKWSRFSRGLSREILEGLPAFKDILVYRGGVEITLPLWEIRTRAGYAFVPAFTPDQSGITNYLDNDKHIFSFGIGKFFHSFPGLHNQVKFDAAFQWQYWQTRETVKAVQDLMTDGTYQPGYFYGGNLFVGQVSVTFYL